MRLGIWILGLASVAAGVLDLVWGEFEAAHQPIQALGDNIPHLKMLAYCAATWLIVGGFAVLSRRTARFGAIALAIIYFLFGAFWLPRLYTATRILGLRADVFIGVFNGVATQFIVVAAAVLLYTFANGHSLPLRAVLSARVVFGISSLLFGLGHLTSARNLSNMVPGWMPLGGVFWVDLTGICFVLAGIAILIGIKDVLAARLLALMLLVFSVIALLPNIAAQPHNHIVWGSNAYNLAAVGATWIFAESLASRKTFANSATHKFVRTSSLLRPR